MTIDLAIARGRITRFNCDVTALTIRFTNCQFDAAASLEDAAEVMRAFSLVTAIGLALIIARILSIFSQAGQARTRKINSARNVYG